MGIDAVLRFFRILDTDTRDSEQSESARAPEKQSPKPYYPVQPKIIGKVLLIEHVNGGERNIDLRDVEVINAVKITTGPTPYYYFTVQARGTQHNFYAQDYNPIMQAWRAVHA